MRDEQYRHLPIDTDRLHQVDDLVLTLQIETGEWLIQEQELRMRQQCLRNQEALLLAARKQANRLIGVA